MGDDRGVELAGRLAPLARYALAWLAAGALAAALVVVALPDGDGETVAVAPLERTDLGPAARAAGCELRAAGGRRLPLPVVGDPESAPAAPGVYDRPPPDPSLVTALRRGRIVIYHDPELPAPELTTIRGLQATVPNGTLVVARADLPYALAATAWRRVLACPHVSEGALESVRLFRARFLGRGPDAPR